MLDGRNLGGQEAEEGWHWGGGVGERGSCLWQPGTEIAVRGGKLGVWQALLVGKQEQDEKWGLRGSWMRN